MTTHDEITSAIAWMEKEASHAERAQEDNAEFLGGDDSFAKHARRYRLIIEALKVAQLDTRRLDLFESWFSGQGERNPRAQGGTVWRIKFPGIHTTSLRAAIDQATTGTTNNLL